MGTHLFDPTPFTLEELLLEGPELDTFLYTRIRTFADVSCYVVKRSFFETGGKEVRASRPAIHDRYLALLQEHRLALKRGEPTCEYSR